MKKVAIIGAGASGAACAFQLEKLDFNGIIHIFDNKKGPFEPNTYAELTPEILHRPIQDFIAYLADNYGLMLKSAARIFHSKNYGPSTEAEFYGFLGHVMKRGGAKDSLENQIRSQLKTKIQFGMNIDYKTIVNEYDYIVNATGNCSYLAETVRFRVDAHIIFNYAIVKEQRIKISANQVECWLNNKYIHKGYSYKMPLDEGLAMFAVVGEYKTPEEIEKGWQLFKQEQINGNYEIMEEHQIKNYVLGTPDQIRIGNTFLTGVNAGCNNPFLGFGVFKSILSGIYAADSIVSGVDYVEKMKFIRDEYDRGLAMLERMHLLGNVGYDLIIKAAASDLASSIMETGGPNVVHWISKLAKWTHFVNNDKSEYLSNDEQEELNRITHKNME
ncbi:hypothetical protein [Bacillus alkalicellulosilyticus]|uniref:hypothetical protein n=1 Tax=Alkalihalobacterium alkalicellulosilyticum TaxID=1912214 RepID=UPI0009962A40|nr:hypothetical protein [Bacillus alkalicellulosilyticus]